LLITGIIAFGFFLRKAYPDYNHNFLRDLNNIKKITVFSFGSYVSNYLFLAPSRIAPILVLEKISQQASATTYVAWMVATMVISPGVSLGLSALAESSHHPNKGKQIVIRSSKIALLIILPLAFIIVVFGEELLGAFGVSYTPGTIGLLRILMISAPFAAFTALFFAWLRIRSNVRELVAAASILALCAIAFPILMVERIGATSLGFGWLLGNTIVSIYGSIRIFKA
jgi:O-antigen/teichoic acid export membrane protein